MSQKQDDLYRNIMRVLDEYNMQTQAEIEQERDPEEVIEAAEVVLPVEENLANLQRAIIIMWPLFSQTLAWSVHQRSEEIPIIRAEAGLVRSDDVAQVIDTIMAVLRTTKRKRL